MQANPAPDNALPAMDTEHMWTLFDTYSPEPSEERDDQVTIMIRVLQTNFADCVDDMIWLNKRLLMSILSSSAD